MKLLLVLFCILGISSSQDEESGLQPKTLQVNYSQPYSLSVNKSIEYILEFSGIKKNRPPRVKISSSNADPSRPIMIVARTHREQLSWQVPLTVESQSGDKLFNETMRTLCHDFYKHRRYESVIVHDYPIVTISTASKTNIDVEVEVDHQDDFYVQPSKEYNFSISPSQSIYFYYNFTQNNVTKDKESNYDTVVLEVNSEDDICMIVSIQNISCPVLDSNQDITYRGFYETVNRKGGITIPKYKFPNGFFIVFVAQGDDFECTGTPGVVQNPRNKNIRMIVKPNITYDDYVLAVSLTLGAIVAFYLVFGIAFFLCSGRNYIPRQMQFVSNSSTPASNINRIEQDLADTISVDETEYDVLNEVDEDRTLRLGKSILYLCDTARKDPRIHKQRSYLYLYNVMTIALFYGLPVIQLVVTYQKVLNKTGEQDLCYYNFLCAHPLGFLSDFNHVFSNLGYVMFGLLFLWITYRRELTHKDLDFDRQYGIPQHYGMFYAMGVALIMEGILSGSYHVCPNNSNFQFDSSFMYVMAVLCMVKLYQNRHPDINATSYATFGVLAIAILLGMIGLLEGNLSFWICFTVLHLLACLYLSAQVYFMGCWRIDRGTIFRIWNVIKQDFRAGIWNVFKPTHPARFLLLLSGNLVNWALAMFAITHSQSAFALYLLGVFMVNTLLYFLFYIIMKYWYRERVNYLTWFFLTLSLTCAASAMYFFLHKSISWSQTAAVSRQYNQECKLLRFYDFHDIWHFLSAIGMFFMFMVLLTLDDDLSHVHRSAIRVF